MKKLYTKAISILLCAFVLMSSSAYAAPQEPLSSQIDTQIVVDGDIEFKIAGEATATSRKAIVVIPGVGGSRLTADGQIVWISNEASKLDKLACYTDGSSKKTVGTLGNNDGIYGPYDTYGFLYRRLATKFSSTYDVLFFPYDWRLSNNTTANKLASALNAYDEVVLVCHSMGGLVASKYLMTASNRSKVSKLITIGTPFQGAPHLVYVAESGDFNILFLVSGVAPNVINLVQNFHATYQLAPTAEYTEGYITNYDIKYGKEDSDTYTYARPWAMNGSSVKRMRNDATSFHASLYTNNTHIANSNLVDTYRIVGNGKDTIRRVIYRDGKFIAVERANSGDGTVPIESARNGLYSSRVKSYTDTHTGLVNNADVATYIVNIISGVSTASTIEEEEILYNEKGWIIGTDNQRVSVIVDADAEVQITDTAGEPLERIGSTLYRTDGSEAGTIWVLGNNEIEYYMQGGEFEFHVDETTAVNRDLTVRYQNDGYYEYGEVYNDLPSGQLQVSIPAYEVKQAEVTAIVENQVGELGPSRAPAAPTIIAPTHILDENELEFLNQ